MTKKILFLCEHSPFNYNFTGLSSLQTSNLELLSNYFQNVHFKVVTTNMFNVNFKEDIDLDYFVKKFSKNTYELIVVNEEKAVMKFSSAIFSLKKRISYFFPSFNNDSRKLYQIKEQFQPDLIWSEHLYNSVICCQLGMSFIYSHHDFIYKLKLIRQLSVRSLLKSTLLKSIEILAIKNAKKVVSGSLNEKKIIQSINLKTYFKPTLYNSIKIDKESINPKVNVVELIHLGTLKATANRIGLIEFLKNVVPILDQLKVNYKLHLIGDLNNLDQKYPSLFENNRIVKHGFVQNLNEILKPYQIHIIPYNKATGTRTRIPLALNYNQLLMSTKNGANGIDGLIHLKNCILTEGPTKMAHFIKNYKEDMSLYRDIADKGKVLFESKYSIKTQTAGLREILS